MKTFIQTILLTFGILILLVGSLVTISVAGEFFSEPASCKRADEYEEKVKKLVQENNLKAAVGLAQAMESAGKDCYEERATAKSKFIGSSAATIIGLLMAIGGFFIRGKTV